VVTLITFAFGGPSEHHSTSLSNCSFVPVAMISTLSSSQFFTVPFMPSWFAFSCVLCLKNTPCTLPSTFIRIVCINKFSEWCSAVGKPLAADGLVNGEWSPYQKSPGLRGLKNLFIFFSKQLLEKSLFLFLFIIFVHFPDLGRYRRCVLFYLFVLIYHGL